MVARSPNPVIVDAGVLSHMSLAAQCFPGLVGTCDEMWVVTHLVLNGAANTLNDFGHLVAEVL
jgi:hypothetical protein